MGVRHAAGTHLRWAALLGACVCMLGFAHGSYARIPVTVNEVTVSARPGETVGAVIDAVGGYESPKILAATDGRVVGARPEVRPVILRDGMPVAEDAQVGWGDQIRIRTASNIVEPTRIETRAVEVQPRVFGRGVTTTTIDPGVVGVEQRTIGVVAGDVIETTMVVQPRPGLCRLAPAAGAPVVALTFDDGPWPGQTEAILKILADRNVPATFFMLGSCVDKRPAVARAVVQAGHAVGNHTYRHTGLDATTPTTAEWEIRATNWAIQQATGARPHWLRAPGGRLEGPAAAYISASGMASALWTVDPQDWRKEATSAGIADTVIRSVRPGAIVVLHDGGGDRSATIAALPVIIDRLRAAGYEFVTLDEMPAVRATW